jgi:hypothetical protein
VLGFYGPADYYGRDDAVNWSYDIRSLRFLGSDPILTTEFDFTDKKLFTDSQFPSVTLPGVFKARNHAIEERFSQFINLQYYYSSMIRSQFFTQSIHKFLGQVMLY